MCGFDQHSAIGSFIHPTLQADREHAAGNLLPRWFPAFQTPTKWVIILAYPVAFASALFISTGARANALGLTDRARLLYWLGASLSAGHFLFGPGAMNIIARICKVDKAGAPNERAVRDWMAMNRKRMWTVDGPAWMVYVIATVLSLVK